MIHGRPRVVPKGVCRSWPACKKPPTDGDIFCSEHRAALDRVIATTGKDAKFDPATALANVKVSHIDAAAGPAPRTRGPLRIRRTEFVARILDALKAGPLYAADLAGKCGAVTDSNTFGNNTFSRAKRDLAGSGRITVEHVGRNRRYSLAPA